MAKRILLIDNDDLTESIITLNDLARKKNIPIECYPLQVGLPDGNDVVDINGKIDFNLVLAKFNELYGNLRFHIMASDFKLNDDIIDGVEIIRRFNAIPNTIKTGKILYSSELEEIVQKYLDDYKNGTKNFQSSWTSFKTLIKLNILDFAKREVIEESILNYIQKISEQEDDFIVDELLANSDLEFNPSLEIYSDFKFKEIADKILTNDPSSLKFKKKLIQLSISHFGYLKNE